METFRFRIADSYTPETLPMARLAEYMAEYAKLLGETSAVHFEKVTEGSTVLAARAEEPAAPKVRLRILSVAHHTAPDDAQRAWDKLNELLADDNATGQIIDHAGAEIIAFPGKNRRERIVFGPFTQEGFLDGEIIRIGGRDETIRVQLRDEGTVYSNCTTSRELAHQMRHHLLGPIVRAHGSGKWVRHADGEWELKEFRIKAFDVLRDDALSVIVNDLRVAHATGWGSEDPIGDVLRDRGTDGGSVTN